MVLKIKGKYQWWKYQHMLCYVYLPFTICRCYVSLPLPLQNSVIMNSDYIDLKVTLV